jgi:uncharacterized protein YbjT (DUF2867 family)
MKVVIFGASGMVGQGVLRECLLDPGVEEVLLVGRRAPAFEDSRVRVVHHTDFTSYDTVSFEGYDACFFCLGVSAAGKTEEAYRHITYDFTLAAARALQDQAPSAVFTYVSGAGTNSTGRLMWARVKGRTENALLDLPLTTYMFRPGYIQPLHGVTSGTRLYRVIYRLTGWLYPLLDRFAPSLVTTNEQLGRAMLKVARDGWPQPILETIDIRKAGGTTPT